MKRSATAVWTGSLKEGSGTLSAPGGALKSTPYSFGSRFASGAGTNPEELIAAAHASCYAMALSGGFAKAGGTPESLVVEVEVRLGPDPAGGFRIPDIAIRVRGKVAGLDEAGFVEAANVAKLNCPVSKALTGTTITLDAALG